MDIARENAEINGVTDVQWDVAAGTDAELIQGQAPYQMVFANILAGPLVELAPDINQVIAPKGHLILAGLLDEQEERVQRAYEDEGFHLVRKGGTERWPTLTLVKDASNA